MDTIKVLSKLNEEAYLNRDHKIILLLLWEQFINIEEKKNMSPKEIEDIGLYKISKIHTTLKDLNGFGLVDNMKGKYQITPKFQYLLGKITYKAMKVEDGIGENITHTINFINEYLEDKPLTRTQRSNLLNDLKITSNSNKTILHYFKEWFGDIEGHKYFNEYKQYENHTL